jgi:hypothetical protein
MRDRIIRLTLKTAEGDKWHAESPLDLINDMKLADWSRPSTIRDFKHRVQIRTSIVYGTTFVYWDATSFLIGYAEVTGGSITWMVGA